MVMEGPTDGDGQPHPQTLSLSLALLRRYSFLPFFFIGKSLSDCVPSLH